MVDSIPTSPSVHPIARRCFLSMLSVTNKATPAPSRARVPIIKASCGRHPTNSGEFAATIPRPPLPMRGFLFAFDSSEACQDSPIWRSSFPVLGNPSILLKCCQPIAKVLNACKNIRILNAKRVGRILDDPQGNHRCLQFSSESCNSRHWAGKNLLPHHSQNSFGDKVISPFGFQSVGVSLPSPPPPWPKDTHLGILENLAW